MVPQSASGAGGSSSASAGESPRPAAAARSPPPRKGDSTTLCASRSLRRLLLRRRTPAPVRRRRRGPAPLLESGAGGRRGRGRGSERGRPAAPRGNGLAPGHPGARSPQEEAAERDRFPGRRRPRRSRSRSALGLGPAAAGPATLFRESGPSRPLSAPVRPRPRRPPRAGLLERSAPRHLTVRPVNQRPPCAPSPPAAARRAIDWSGAPRPARLPVRAAPGARMGASHKHPLFTLPEKWESRPHSRQPAQFE